MTALQLDEDACKKTLMSLSSNKCKILIRAAGSAASNAAAVESNGDATMIDTTQQAAQQSQTSEVTETEGVRSILNDRFHFNENFKSNQYRLNLPIPAIEEEATQTKKTKIVQDRAHAVDATIVKRMKTNKRMEFKDLLAEVMQALSMFQPQPQFVKQRIEKLIADEFLARDAEDRAILIYMP